MPVTNFALPEIETLIHGMPLLLGVSFRHSDQIAVIRAGAPSVNLMIRKQFSPMLRRLSFDAVDARTRKSMEVRNRVRLPRANCTDKRHGLSISALSSASGCLLLRSF